MSERYYNTDCERVETGLRDAKKQGYFPSVTKVLDIVHSEGLDRYKEAQHYEAMKSFYFEEEKDAPSFDQYMDEVDAHRNWSASIGQHFHDVAEAWGRQKMDPEAEIDMPPSPVMLAMADRKLIEWLEEEVVEVYAVEAMGISTALKIGGTLDMYAKLKTWGESLLDFKGRPMKPPGRKKDGTLKSLNSYKRKSWAPQLAAYSMLNDTMMPSEDGPRVHVTDFQNLTYINVAISHDPLFTHVHPFVHTAGDMARAMDYFKTARHMYELTEGI